MKRGRAERGWGGKVGDRSLKRLSVGAEYRVNAGDKWSLIFFLVVLLIV